MIEAGKTNYLLFDGDCGFCTYSAEWIERIDAKRRFVVEPYQRYPESELNQVGLDYEACSRKVQLISRTGRVYSGAFALNYFLLRQFPWSVLVVVLYLVPILLLVEVVGYAIVAKNRYRLSRWLGLTACLAREAKNQDR